MQRKFILSFDQGTTSSRGFLFDERGVPVAKHARAHQQIYPHPGWVSHNPEEIYFNILEIARRTMEAASVKASEIAAIGITNQRETLVAWDKETGDPVCDAIVWQCKRTAGLCKQVIADGFDQTIRKKTGLITDPYFSATKMKWILDNIPEARVLLQKGRLLMGTMDSYIIWRLTGGAAHVTDYTNASRTMLFDITALRWDPEIMAYFGIPQEVLPKVVASSGIAGYTNERAIGAKIPICGIAGDQHAALFGQTCFAEGDVKNTYGTGSFVLKNTGSKPIISDSKLLTTIAWHIGGQTTYALEGSVFTAGAAVEWLIKEAKLADDVQEINNICMDTADTSGVYFVPAFSGLGAPHWDMYARGTLCGLSLATGRKHIVRAVMEAVAFQSRDVIDYMETETGVNMNRLRVDGGVCRSDFVMQFQSDILNILVERPKNIETTVLGAAFLAGLAISFFDGDTPKGGLEQGMDAIKRRREVDAVFSPRMSQDESRERYGWWQKAVERAKGWEGQPEGRP